MIQNDIAAHLDLANHHADATGEDVRKLCANVLKYGFNAAFVNPCYIAFARKEIGDKAKVGCTISFPLGQDTTEMKIYCVKEAIRLGADELDVGTNNGLLLAGEADQFTQELREIVSTVRKIKVRTVIKFILETGYLSDENIRKGVRAIVEAGADFVKICSGMGPRGASLNDVRLVKEVLRSRIPLRGTIGNAPIKIKVAGGIDTIEEVRAFLDAGVHRIGTSKAVEIMEQSQAP